MPRPPFYALFPRDAFGRALFKRWKVLRAGVEELQVKEEGAQSDQAKRANCHRVLDTILDWALDTRKARENALEPKADNRNVITKTRRPKVTTKDWDGVGTPSRKRAK